MAILRPFKRGILLSLMAALALAPFVGAVDGEAQERGEMWPDPVQLSSPRGSAGEAYMVPDAYGGLNVFWAEWIFDSNRSLIYYSRFDGTTWTEPIDIYASWEATEISSIAVAIDHVDNLHLIWSEGPSGPVFHSKAPLKDAGDARSWSDPRSLGIPAKAIELEIDGSGTAHAVYIVTEGEFPGVYHIQTHVSGRMWSYPQRVDDDIPSAAVPDSLDLTMDHRGGLHAVWSYVDAGGDTLFGRSVRYSQKLAGSTEWGFHQSIDGVGFQEEYLRSPRPKIAVTKDMVHVIWGATHNREPGIASINRYQRFSENLGISWGEATPILGDLVGQAGGDGVAIDGSDRLHFASQLRWPQAIYHVTWAEGTWGEPQIAYEIRDASTEEVGDRVHAHFVRIGVIQGNVLVLIFRTAREAPQGVLYATTLEMEGVVHLEPQELGKGGEMPGQPTPSEQPTRDAAEVVIATPVETEVSLDEPSDPGTAPSNDLGFVWLSIIPVLLLVGGVLMYQRIAHRP